MGPTIVEVKPGMSAYENEIFGPVLGVICAESLDEAIKLINANK